MPVIHFYSEEIVFRLNQKKRLKAWINIVAKSENKSLNTISFVFCKDDYLYKYNVKYLKHNTLTDIITFDYSENDEISGDLFISVDRVKENAKELKGNFVNELHRVMVHGILHLVGYSDKTVIQKKEMRNREDYYLSLRTF